MPRTGSCGLFLFAAIIYLVFLGPACSSPASNPPAVWPWDQTWAPTKEEMAILRETQERRPETSGGRMLDTTSTHRVEVNRPPETLAQSEIRRVVKELEGQPGARRKLLSSSPNRDIAGSQPSRFPSTAISYARSIPAAPNNMPVAIQPDPNTTIVRHIQHASILKWLCELYSVEDNYYANFLGFLDERNNIVRFGNPRNPTRDAVLPSGATPAELANRLGMIYAAIAGRILEKMSHGMDVLHGKVNLSETPTYKAIYRLDWMSTYNYPPVKPISYQSLDHIMGALMKALEEYHTNGSPPVGTTKNEWKLLRLGARMEATKTSMKLKELRTTVQTSR